MTPMHFYILFGCLALVPAFQIIHAKYMQNLRLRLIDLAEDVLTHEATTEAQAETVTTLLDDAFNWKNAIWIAIVTTPITVHAVLTVAIGAERTGGGSFSDLMDHPKGLRLVDNYFFVTILSNPIAAVLILLQFIPIMLLATVYFKSVRAAKRFVERNVIGYVATAEKI